MKLRWWEWLVVGPVLLALCLTLLELAVAIGLLLLGALLAGVL